MSRIVWSATKGWHDGPEITEPKPVRHNKQAATAAARIHAASTTVSHKESK